VKGAIRSLLKSPNFHFAASSALRVIGFLSLALTCRALPSFARQLNMSCIACHTEYPLLNEFGRQFKLTGYTLSAETSTLPPIAVMLQPSFTATQADQPGGAAAGFGKNNNFALTQASIFYAGRLFGPYGADLFGADSAAIANKFGIFSQTTYNGVAKTWGWDNTELRFADKGKFGARDFLYGIYVNNNPTMEDPWNSTPAWGFPFTGSGLAPVPAASPLITGALAHQVGGLGAYVMVSNTVYLDLGAYHTLAPQFQRTLGTDPMGETQVPGLAPYWRLAVEKSATSSTWELGTFGMLAGTYPGRDSTAGKDQIADLGADSEYQFSDGTSDITILGSMIYEHSDWKASRALGNASNSSDRLLNEKLTVDYLFDKTVGAAAQIFYVDGSIDPLLYADSVAGSATSNGLICQLNYLPFNKGGGPAFWPRSNVKLSLQYVAYAHFDGTARNASGNNTLYLETWIVF
jgi:hypothetical protein